MKVILTTDVKSQGKKGDVINVSDGFARNYLFPRGLAVEANTGNMAELSSKRAAVDHRKAEEKATAEELKSKVDTLIVEISAKAGAGGRLFGSVTSKEIAEAVKTNNGIVLDKKKILLEEPIRSFGVTKVNVRLHPEVTASLSVRVVEEK